MENIWHEGGTVKGITVSARESVTYGREVYRRGPMPWWGYVIAPFVVIGVIAAAPIALVVLIPVAIAGLVVKFACGICGWEPPHWAADWV